MTIASDQGRGSSDRSLLTGIVEAALRAQGSAGWTIRPGKTWSQVIPPVRPNAVQGWKLHVSATPLSAPVVLARCADVLVSHGTAFKFAASIDQVARLTSRLAGRAAGGKFITAYPDTDEARLRDLADALDLATSGLPGPGILSDRRYRQGSLVHYRYGVFAGVPVMGNDGASEAMLIAPDGRLVRDERKAWFCPPPWAPPDPFTEPAAQESAPAPPSPSQPVLLAGRYVVTEAIRHSFAGGVFRADDQRTGRPVIVKQARPHTAVNLTGRDACDRRRHEADMLRLLAPTGTVASLVELFEEQGDLFLVLEQVDGDTLRDWVQEDPDLALAGQIASGLADLMERFHRLGLVLRDFNPNNVMVTGDATLCLLDLELLTPAGVPVPREFTPGYGAPELRASSPADQAADRYSLGATLFYLASGSDPFLPADDPPGVRLHQDRLRDWLAMLAADNPLARRLAPLILELMDEDPARRPDLPAVVQALAMPPDSTGGRAGARRPAALSGARLTRAIDDGIGYLIGTMNPGSKSRLWPVSDSAENTDPYAVHHGAAGILATLIRAQQSQPDQRLIDCISTAAAWIRQRIRGQPRILPGLHFGHAGTAWALLEAGLLLHDEQLVAAAEELAARLPLTWPNPDICHGTAGAGLAQLRFFEITGNAVYLDRAGQAAGSVASAARHSDGMLIWPVPEAFPSGLAGACHLGFAHGVAGIGAFLLAAGQATGHRRYLDLAVDAAATLAATAEMDGEAAYWPAEPGRQRRTHWCSGSSGVGTFLVRAWEQTGDQRLSTLAIQAAAAVYKARWRAGPSQCHGLAGDAEFLLDLAQALDRTRYRTWAGELAACIYARHAIRDQRMVAPDETGKAVMPGYGVGLAGVLALLLRLRAGGSRMWLPQSAISQTKGGESHANRYRRTSALAAS